MKSNENTKALAMLSVERLTRYFGHLCIIDGLSFSVCKGECVGIIGPNGAGKTTLFNLVAGALPPDEGTIVFKGRDIGHLPADKRCRLGIGRTFQIPRSFTQMSVYENVLVGASNVSNLREKDHKDKVGSILELTHLSDLANVPAGNLTLLQRKRLSLARALSTSPEILLLDEVAGGLTDHEVEEFLILMDNIRHMGVTIIWIEHVLHALSSFVDRIIAISFGEMIADGSPDRVLTDPEVQEIYMGVDESYETNP